METVLTVDHTNDISDLLALDRPSGCPICTPEETAAAHGTLTDLCRWWLGKGQRLQWRVYTFVDAKQRADGTASDAIFKFVLPGRASPIPVFLVLIQHQEGKRRPHYQLQVPHGSLGENLRDADLARQIAALADETDRRTVHLRSAGLKSIDLHRPLKQEDVQAIQDAAAALLLGLRDLNWSGAN